MKKHSKANGCKAFQILKFVVAASFILFIFSCSTKITFSIRQNKINVGDSILARWKIIHPYKLQYVAFADKGKEFPLSGRTYFKPLEDTSIEFKVYQKGKSQPIKKISKNIKVIIPSIKGFSAIRDRFNRNNVILSWNIKDMPAKKNKNFSVSIEGYSYDLPANGTVTLSNITSAKTFNLVLNTPLGAQTKSCYVDEYSLTQRPMIVKDTAIFMLPGNHKIFMKITETNLGKYPDSIRLKVIVYDSLGNFITHLAPPFADSNVCKKYFQRIIDKVNNVSTEVKFKVKEYNNSPDLYDLALVLDYSGSMCPYMDFYKKATRKFIDNKYPGDFYSVTKFDHRLAPASPLTTDTTELVEKTGLKSKIDTLFGSTALYAGIDCGLQSLENSPHKRLVMTFTDGYENSSFNYFGTYAWDIDQMILDIRKQNASLMLMGLGLTNTVLLNEMTYYSNGDFYYLADPDEITQVYQDMQHNMRTYYEITFKPVQSENEHQVQLTYFNNIDTTTTTRPVYIGNNIKIDHDLKKFQVDTTAYWYDKELAKKGYNFVMTPQSLAYFATNEDSIGKKYYPQLQKLVTYLQDNPGTYIRIFGHTDTRGDSIFNCDLSKKRAESFWKFLLHNGIKSDRIKYFGMGSKYPINKNDTEDWAAKENRRAEVVIWKK